MSILALLFSNWSWDPQVIVGLIIMAVLYVRGLRYAQRLGIERHPREPWRIAMFVLSWLTLFIALNSPLDYWAGTYVWAHMTQHELLSLVAAPLLLLSQPFMLMWRGVPLRTRRDVLRRMTRARWPMRTLEGFVEFMRRPVVSWVAFTGLFSVWHLPALYDLAVENDVIHAAEHICFMVTAVFFWSQIIPCLPWKPRINHIAQAGYFVLAAIWGNAVGWAFMTATSMFYPYYAALPRTPGMFAAIDDLHFAGGVMDVADTFAFISMILLALGLWLVEEERKQNAMSDGITSALAQAPQPGARAL